jgi:hypothetical protein
VRVAEVVVGAEAKASVDSERTKERSEATDKVVTVVEVTVVAAFAEV